MIPQISPCDSNKNIYLKKNEVKQVDAYVTNHVMKHMNILEEPLMCKFELFNISF